MTGIIEPDAIYTAEEVAQLLFRHGVRWFYEHRPRLERREDFPRPISPVGRPRWRGATLLAWSERPDRSGKRASIRIGMGVLPEPERAEDLSARFREQLRQQTEEREARKALAARRAELRNARRFRAEARADAPK